MMLVDVQSEQSWSLDKEAVLIYNIYYCATWFGHYIIPIFPFVLFFCVSSAVFTTKCGKEYDSVSKHLTGKPLDSHEGMFCCLYQESLSVLHCTAIVISQQKQYGFGGM